MMKTNKLKQEFLNKLISFRKDVSGQITVIMVIVFVPLAAFIGGALDFTQKVSYESKLQATLDSVSIAIAKEIARNSKVSNKELRKIGDIIFNANNAAPDNITAKPYVISRGKEKLVISQVASLDTSFMKLVGVKELVMNVASTVNIKRSDVELVLVLDTTGSMGSSNKLADLKTASKNLINTLIQDTTGLGSMRVGLVPWSVGVNVYADRKNVIVNNNGGKHYCSGSRKTPEDKSPTTKKLPFAYDNWDRERCPNRGVMPLTDNKKKLLAEIGFWKAENYTSSDAGLTWGWGVLSPKWNNYWNSENEAKSYTGGVKKYLVLMTDGDNTVDHVGADQRSKKLCNKMKKKGIKIYSIAFKAGKNAQKLLKKCATSADMYIDASSGDALKAAFERIADEVGAFYLSG